jgi:4-hydroxybenzoate polyprenyltransferase
MTKPLDEARVRTEEHGNAADISLAPAIVVPPHEAHEDDLATIDADVVSPIMAAAPERLPRVLWRALRPRQWTKNVAVLAPLFFAHHALDPRLAAHALIATLAFCLLSSAVYLCNDVVDRERDRRHPAKRHRPIASGALSVPSAVAIAALLAGLALGTFAWLGLAVLAGAVGYLALQALYTVVLKKQVIVDVIAIAIGFVLRVATGALSVGVPISNWLYLCTFLLALFLGFSKRRAELALLQERAAAHRPGLDALSLPLLDQLIAAVTASTILAFALYTMSPDTIAKFGSEHLMLTLPCVVYGVFRYLFLVYRKGAGGSPEKLLLRDKPLLIAIALFVLIAGAVIYGPRPMAGGADRDRSSAAPMSKVSRTP